jgi:hypothetical protein
MSSWHVRRKCFRVIWHYYWFNQLTANCALRGMRAVVIA